MNKKLIAPIVTAAAMLATSVGTTFALFSSKASSRIDINAGKVAVNYDASVSKALSRYEDLEPWDAIANKTETHAATFENGSTADISVESTGAVVTLDRLAPMDMIELKVGATNDSNINIKFRYFIKASGDLLPALNLIVDGAKLEMSGSTFEFYSIWSTVKTPTVESLFEKNVGIYFPDHDDIDPDFDNQYQGKNASIEIGIEAIQGNAEVHNDHDIEPINTREIVHAPKPSEDRITNIESQTGAQSYAVPFEACDENADELVLTITPEETPTADVPAGKDYLAYDVHIDGIKEDNTAEIDATIGIGSGKTNVEVWHNGEKIDSEYKDEEGSVHFKATSFSPYDVTFDAAREEGYGFYNSYKVDEGLETEHWVHEISNAEEFRNIVDSTVHDLKTGAHDYPGAHKEETVYLIVDDIDFDGEVWNTPELVNEVNAYPFIGNLIGDGEGATLSNVHVTSLYNGLDDNSMFCFFSRAVNASFENLTLKDCTLSNALGDKCAILVGGNKTTEASYKTLFGDDNFAIKYLTFKNVLVDSTCSVSCSECAAGVCAVLRYFRADGCITFENVVNLADISASKGNVGGILGQMSLNPANNQHLVPTYFTNCENSGTIEGGSGNVGGLVGYLCSSTAVVKDCSNHGDINFNNTSTAVGAISGASQNGTAYVNCTNDGFIYTKGSSCNDFTHGRVVLYNEKGTDEVSLAEYNSLFLKPYVGNEISVSLNKDSGKIEVDTSDGADHYSLVITATKVDIDASTNKACADRSGTVIIAGLNNISPAEVTNLSVITQLGYFAPGPGECPVDEHHGGTRIGSLGIKTTSEYFLDYALHGTEGYEAGYGVNSKGGYVIYDNTGNDTGYWQCLITWRLNISYSFVGYNSGDEVISRGSVTDSPYALGGDKNYVTSIVGYTPDVM